MIYRLKATAFWLILLLILQPIFAHASPSTRPTSMQEWHSYVKVIAKKYKLDPNLCAALAAGESGKGKKEVRFGPVCNGKYYAPYNIHESALKKWNITNWKVNTEVGIMLLSNKLKRANGNLWIALRTYNTGDKGKKYNSYINNIKRLQNLYKERGIFDDPILPLAKLKNRL